MEYTNILSVFFSDFVLMLIFNISIIFYYGLNFKYCTSLLEKTEGAEGEIWKYVLLTGFIKNFKDVFQWKIIKLI